MALLVLACSQTSFACLAGGSFSQILSSQAGAMALFVRTQAFTNASHEKPLSRKAQPSGPGWRCWSGCGTPNQTGQGGTVGRDLLLPRLFFVFIVCVPLPFPNQAGTGALLVGIPQTKSEPNQAGPMALLVGACFFLASLLWRKRAACECFVAEPPQPSGPGGTVGQGFQPNGPKRHCWSEGGSVNILTRFFPKFFALFVSWQCPNQSGPSGSVGQDSDMLADPSPETLISQPSGPQWHCWSGLQQKCQERLPPLSDLAMSQPSGPRWHCWSGLPHAEALDL